MNVVRLTRTELQYCVHHAHKVLQSYEGRVGVYGHNRFEGCFIGVKGEVAAANWIESSLSCPIVRNYETMTNFHHRGDITVMDTLEIEVKTIRPLHWRQFRMMVPPSQLEQYVSKNAIVFWATATPNETCSDVTLCGWNFATEIQQYGVEKQTICQNIWLQDATRLRNMDTFSRHFKN